jgi:ABC-type glycerol-3-phosphate transport system substrate-binding protein
MQSPKRISTFFAAAVVTAAFAAAGPADAQQQRVLKIMGYQSTFVQYREGWEYTLREFERRNPGVKIEEVATAFDQTLNQITVSVLGNNAPDVVMINPIWMAQLDSIGALENLEPFVPADELKLFPKRVLEDLSIDGTVRGLALNAGPIMMIYNRDLMKEAGMDPDKPPQTWAEFAVAVKRICALPPRAGGKTYGVALRTERQPIAAQWTIPVIYANGGEVSNDKGEIVLDTPAAISAFNWYHDTVRNECSPEGATVADARNLFAQGRAGFVFEGPWIAGLVDALSNKKLKVGKDANIWAAQFPADSTGRRRQIANHGALAMTKQAKDKKLASDFIRFAVGDRAVVEYAFSTAGVISTSRLDLLNSGKHGADPFSQLFVPALDNAIALPMKHARWSAAMDPVTVALQRVIQGADAKSELSQAEREARRIMSRR